MNINRSILVDTCAHRCWDIQMIVFKLYLFLLVALLANAFH